jgi:hypothetical protein
MKYVYIYSINTVHDYQQWSKGTTAFVFDMFSGVPI